MRSFNPKQDFMKLKLMDSLWVTLSKVLRMTNRVSVSDFWQDDKTGT